MLENSDSDIEGDELDDMLFGHNEGSNYAFVDGHCKWHKAEFANNDPTDSNNWVYPPAGGGGASGDFGPWTAWSND
jgi:prepilin-type processing-associated H-X9-DG protein